ncbi:MAG: PTS IIA-like nitrogen regulatory protein PtsN [Pseudomonadota bacterium]|nr:PTS IIA-like nitrogen regulatory protein PtsN [Pseudomonadota bacterium]
MEIEDILSADRIVTSLDAGSKKHALQELAGKAASQTGLQEHEIFDVLMQRERLGTTGVGSGIAIPHGKMPDLDELFGCFARLDNPVDFDAVDGEPVDLIFLLLAPESVGADHLKALARISRVLRNAGKCDKLRLAKTPERIFNLLTQDAQIHAA